MIIINFTHAKNIRMRSFAPAAAKLLINTLVKSVRSFTFNSDESLSAGPRNKCAPESA